MTSEQINKQTPLTKEEIEDLKEDSKTLEIIARYVDGDIGDHMTIIEAVMQLKAYWHRNEARKIDEDLHA